MTVLRGLDRLPRSADLYEWADFAELMCVVNPDRQTSRADLIGRVKRAKDMDVDSAAGSSGDPPTTEPNTVGDAAAEISDHWHKRADDVFLHLRSRGTALGAGYPFEVSGVGTSEMVKLKAGRTDPQRLYLLLLVCANLRYVSKTHWDVLTTAFELVAASTLRGLLPPQGEVHHFGPRHAESRYTGLLFEKIELLAKDLNERLVAEAADFKAGDTGDGGLDLLGWCPPLDMEPTRALIFAQCACGEEWVEKQHSSGPETWVGRIAFRAAPRNMTFIPVSFRDEQGRWASKDKIHQSVLYDRLRIMLLLQSLNGATVPPIANTVVENLLTEVEAA